VRSTRGVLVKRIVILEVDDWQGMYDNGELVDEGHTLAEGDLLYMLKESEKRGFTTKDVEIHWLTSDGERWMNDIGRFPGLLSEVPAQFIPGTAD